MEDISQTELVQTSTITGPKEKGRVISINQLKHVSNCFLNQCTVEPREFKA